MDELRKEYTILFNGITDMIGMLENMITRLKRLQMEAEEQATHLESEQPPATGADGETVMRLETKEEGLPKDG